MFCGNKTMITLIILTIGLSALPLIGFMLIGDKLDDFDS
jgi:hypothetical protein